MIDNLANARAAYAGQLILTSGHAASMDSWATGLNNNVLVLGCSGSGKTRNFLKPNLLQCEGSYIVLDSKGRLYDEMAPFLRAHGYVVDRLDFTTMDGEIGYDPLHHVRWRKGRPLAQDIIAIASALFPRADMGDDPFWAGAAANYVASYIAYVFEALPDREWNMASVVSVYEQACEGNAEALFADLSKQDPDSYAASLFRRARSTARTDKMHSSIMGIIAANLLPLTFDGALASFRKVQQIDFCDLGRERRALFVTMDDMDRSLAPLTSLFIRQAFSSLCDFADTRCDGGRLPVPVRFMLDDFANLTLPSFDDVLSVIRSREVSCTIICQTVSQLEARLRPGSGELDHRELRPPSGAGLPRRTNGEVFRATRQQAALDASRDTIRKLVAIRARPPRRVRARLCARAAPAVSGVCRKLRDARELGSGGWRSGCNLGGAGESQSAFDLHRRRP